MSHTDKDARRLQTGRVIPTESYCDQPYAVVLDDGTWLLAVTTGAGAEGEGGQHVVSLRSADHGLTWARPVDVEPADGPEASYAVLLKTDFGRVYCFYGHNSDNLRAVKADDPPFPGGLCPRVDSLGHFVFRYTDDGGHTWSDRRYDLPMRDFAIDRENPYGGALKFFWNVGKPFTHAGVAYVPIHKVGGFGEGFFTRSEGALLASDNLLVERSPSALRWTTLPEGEVGLRAPAGGGAIAEEQSFVVDSEGGIHAVYRTVDGHPAQCVSRDGGRTFSAPEYRRFGDGRLMKHPRAANFQWKCANGKYLYWFHNHGGRGYEGRNPAWLSGGVEVCGPCGVEIEWSQPEIALYDDDPLIRVSYPDLIEQDGRYFLTETQKDVARVHELDPALLEGLWAQNEPKRAMDGLLADAAPRGEYVVLPELPALSERDAAAPDHRSRATRAGFTLALDIEGADEARTLLDGAGILARAEADGSLTVRLDDGETRADFSFDARLAEPDTHRAFVIVDGGAHVALCVCDGLLLDGGKTRNYGFGRFSPWLRKVGGDLARADAALLRMRVYGRALRVSEAVRDCLTRA